MCFQNKTRSKPDGFTLLEVILATAIFAIIALGILGAFRAGIFSYEKMDVKFQLSQQANVILGRMERDLVNSFGYLNDDSRFQGTSRSLDFFSIPYSFRQGERQDSICRIKYNWEGSSLRRTCIEGLDALNAQAEEEAKELPGQVSGLSLEYAQKTTEGLVWQDSWPAENNPQQKKQHPQAVRIKLAVSGAGNQDAQQANAIEFTKVVSLE